MMMDAYHLTREELYDLVWSKAMRLLGPELGMSDRGLAKVCRNMEIPLPGLGYWRKVELGQKVKKEPLAKASKTCRQRVFFRSLAQQEKDKAIIEDQLVIRVSENESKPKNAIVVPDRVGKFHPLVKQTVDALLKATPDSYGRLRPHGDFIEICCSKASISRAARILHTLITSLEKRGQKLTVKRKFYRYSHNSYLGTYIEYEGEDIQISIMEKTTQIPHEPKKEKYWGDPKYDYVPNGQLTIKVENAYSYSKRRTWSDTSKKQLETQLNTIMVDLAKIAVFLKIEREKEEREALEAQRRKELQEELQRQRAEEQKRVVHLEALMSDWLKAMHIRQFVELINESPADLSFPNMSKEEWLVWAKSYANQIDPLIARTGD